MHFVAKTQFAASWCQWPDPTRCHSVVDYSVPGDARKGHTLVVFLSITLLNIDRFHNCFMDSVVIN